MGNLASTNHERYQQSEDGLTVNTEKTQSQKHAEKRDAYPEPALSEANVVR
jgi:hypothetical protein